ncbi:YhgE/Pip family protein [Levilactobacillus yonginensis]
MIKGEWNYIRHNRLILISVLAIMFIPFLYCIFFLKSVWDPYGQTGSLPVAVVNQDQPVTYQGQKLNVGDQTVTNLKKNHQLGWKFVSAKTAADGLKHHKYYTVITFPKNFSANAATALNEHPKKMTFSYKTNGSANYIAQVMSEVGSSQLDSQIRSKVTKAYAQATFKQIYSVGKGMEKAATGSAKLKDGTVTLTDGLNTYTTGVHTLNNGLQQMKTSVGPLATGIQKLTTGSQTLKSGLGQYTSGVNAYTGGVSQLSAGMPKLLNGTSQLSAGAKKLNTGVYTYVDGVYQLNSGIGTLSSKVGPLASGVTKLSKGGKDLTSGLSKLDKNSSALKSGATQVNDGVVQLQTMMTQLAPSLSSLTKLTSNPAQLAALQGMLQKLQASGLMSSDKLSELSTQLNSLSGFNATTMSTELSGVQQLLGSDIAAIKAAKSQPTGSNQPSDTSGSGTSNESEISSAQTAANDAATKADALDKAVSGGNADDIKNAAQAAVAATKAAAAKTNAIKSTQSTSTTKAYTTDNTAYDAAVNTLITDVAGVSAKIDEYKTSLSALAGLQDELPQLQGLLSEVAGAKLTSDDLKNMNDALVNLQANSAMINKLGSSSTDLAKLVKGTGDLSTGLDTYTAGVSQALKGSNQLSDGLTTMNKQIPTLTAGVTQLANGSKKLAKNGPALKSGSEQLSSNMSVLYSGLQTAAAGVNKLNANTPKLTAAGNQLNQGATQINSGLTQLNSKVPALTSGVTQLADGSQKLDDNSGQLMSGAKKLSDGNGTLAKSLKSGADQIQAQPLTSKTADMFAAPTKLKHESYSYVPNYGHALAPYVLSVALYVGALVFNFAFPIRKVSRKDGTATGWFFSKVSIGAVEALAMGLIEPALMMLGGLSVDHPGQMMLVSVLFAEASMFIVMFLSMLLDNPGRFIAMVLLMLQLGGSGGTFPMEVTNHFYNVVHPFLPMTYSILGFRQAITSGMSGMVGQAVWVLILFTILALALLWPTMIWLQKKHLMGISQLDNNQELQAVEDPNANNHS